MNPRLLIISEPLYEYTPVIGTLGMHITLTPSTLNTSDLGASVFGFMV